MRQGAFGKSGYFSSVCEVVGEGVGPTTVFDHDPEFGDGRRIATATSASGSVSTPATCQPADAAIAARPSVVNLWLFSVRIFYPAAKEIARPAIRTSCPRRLSRCMSTRLAGAFHAVRWRKAARSKSAPASRFSRASRLSLNAAVAPRGRRHRPPRAAPAP